MQMPEEEVDAEVEQKVKVEEEEEKNADEEPPSKKFKKESAEKKPNRGQRMKAESRAAQFPEEFEAKDEKMWCKHCRVVVNHVNKSFAAGTTSLFGMCNAYLCHSSLEGCHSQEEESRRSKGEYGPGTCCTNAGRQQCGL